MREYNLELEFKPLASKFLNKCDKILLKRIYLKLELLKSNSFPSDCKRIENREEKIFRVRVGDYRIIYSVALDKIFIADIDKRSNIYKLNEEKEEYISSLIH